MTLTKKPREANLDLLRIVSMLLIVFLHSIDHSGVLENAENCSTGMYFYVRFMYALCQVCVNIYVMLSGYFMVNSKFRLHKLVTLWMEATFYSFMLKLVFMLSGVDSFSVISLAGCFFPILTGRYWFLTIYVGMYLVSPFLNTLIHAMNKRQHGMLNLCLFAIMSIWISIHPAIVGMNSGGGWGIAWFVVMYLAAAWLRLYYKPKGKPLGFLGIFLCIPFAMAVAQTVLKGNVSIPGAGILLTIVKHWFRYDSAPVYLMTISLFVAFMNIHIRSEKVSKAIISIAPLTLGVYLIHNHANVAPWSWEVLNLPPKMNSAAFAFIQLGCVLGIFAICAAIDALRNATVGRIENAPSVAKVCNHIQEKLNAFFLTCFKE